MNPFQARNIPNAITLLRIALVPVLLWTMSERQFALTLWLGAFMGATDGIDGFLARRFGWQTRLGAYLDPLADKLMLAGIYLMLGWLELLPLNLVALVVFRDMAILLGAGMYHLLTHRLEMRPTWLGKINTAVQIFLVLLVLIDQLMPLPSWVIPAGLGLTVLTTVASGAGYVIQWSRLARCDMNGGGWCK